MNKPTEEYHKFQHAYDHFNHNLFGGRLPPSLITFQRRKHIRGYFSPYRFTARNNHTLRTDEIALNPDTFAGYDDKDILATLVHEQVHLWQAHEGHPSRSGYHNRQWALEMLRVGLRPISLDRPGKMTGQRVSHGIVPGGPFDEAADRLIATGFCLKWQSADETARPAMAAPAAAAPNRNKMKYTCPACDQNAWAKPNARLICGRCKEEMTARTRG